MSEDQEKIKIAREYFMRADQGRRPDILELFQENVEVYSRNSDFDLDGTRFSK
jgi:ketosteroid isomerase-like protein